MQTPVNRQRDGSDGSDAQRSRAKPRSSRSVSFTPGYQACGALPPLLIKYPKAALVFQLGCVLSVHYWQVFNNSLAGAAEGTPPSICCFNSSQRHCVHFGKMNLKFAFALNFPNRPKCQSGDGNAARWREYYAMTRSASRSPPIHFAYS